MTIDEKTIKDALLKGERETLECKKAQSNIPGSVWETYSAFANTYGGLILSAWNEKHWLKPQLIEQRDLLQVKLILSIETKDVEKNFVKDFVKDFVKELSERQLVILDLITKDPSISAKAISEKISEKTSEKGITDRTIQNDIAKLKQMGILTRKGGRKDGYWIIKKDS
jgi:predicted HTH transcriptional regulator